MEISAAVVRARELSIEARAELKSIEVGETMAGGPMLQLDLGHALVALDTLDVALKRALRHAGMVESAL